MGHNSIRPHCRWAEITEDGWVDPVGDDPGIPIEDFGMYFYTDVELTNEQAFDVFIELIGLEDDGKEADLHDVICAVKGRTQCIHHSKSR